MSKDIDKIKGYWVIAIWLALFVLAALFVGAGIWFLNILFNFWSGK